jgi:hypothetical protein
MFKHRLIVVLSINFIFWSLISLIILRWDFSRSFHNVSKPIIYGFKHFPISFFIAITHSGSCWTLSQSKSSKKVSQPQFQWKYHLKYSTYSAVRKLKQQIGRVLYLLHPCLNCVFSTRCDHPSRNKFNNLSNNWFFDILFRLEESIKYYLFRKIKNGILRLFYFRLRIAVKSIYLKNKFI